MKRKLFKVVDPEEPVTFHPRGRLRTWLRERLWFRVARYVALGRRYARNVRKKHLVSAAEAERLFPETHKCVHCGGWHDHSCPRIRAIVFRGENPARVEFWPWLNEKGKPGWPHDQVIFPWQKAAMIDPDLLEGEVTT